MSDHRSALAVARRRTRPDKPDTGTPPSLPPTTLFANPYGEEYYAYLSDDGDTAYVVSALDTLLLTQQDSPPAGAFVVPATLNLVVWGDTVVVGGPLVLQGKTVTVFARTFGWQAGSNGDPSIDVSSPAQAAPPPPQPQSGPAASGSTGVHDAGGPGSPGNVGAAGNTASDSSDGEAFSPAEGEVGGTISIYASDFAANGTLTLRADGGPGQAGQTGQAGQPGGTGGDGWPVGFAAERDASDTDLFQVWPVWTWHVQDGGNGGQGGAGGAGGIGAKGGAGGTILIAALNAVSANFDCSAQGGDGGAGGNGGAGASGGPGGDADSGASNGAYGAPGNGGSGGVGGAGGDGGSITSAGFTLTSTNLAGGDGGAGGTGGNAGPANGNAPGAAGPTPATAAGGATGSLTNIAGGIGTLSAQANALQCSMMLQKAKLLYLSADPKSNPSGFTRAASTFNWLVELLASVVAGGTTGPDATIFANVYSQAAAYGNQLVLRQDYFGNPFTYVPRVSYNEQESLLSAMIQNFTTLESTYTAYFKALQTNTTATDQLAAQQNAVMAQQSAAEQQLQTVTNDIDGLVVTLDRQMQEVLVAENLMNQAIFAFQQDLISAANQQGCANATIKSMITVGSTLVGIASGGDDTGEDGDGDDGDGSGFPPGNVSDQIQQILSGYGEQFGNSSDILSNLQVLGQDVTSLAQVYNSDPDGVDNDTYKLMVENAQNLENEIQKYTSQIPQTPDGQNAIDAINHFLALIQQRNTTVVQYNSDLADYGSLTSEIERLKQQLAQIDSLSAGQNAGLPWMVSFMSQLYLSVRSQVLYQMYLTNRALNYWSLNPSTVGLGSFVNATDPAAVNSGTLAAANIQILAAFNSALNTFGSGAIAYFPTTAGQTGIVVPFTRAANPTMFSALTTKTKADPKRYPAGYIYTVSVVVPVVTAQTTINQSPFAGWSNVRISTARPWIYGASTSDSNLVVTIIHSGAEALTNLQNKTVSFTHEAIKADFEYNLKTSKISRDADGFGIVSPGGNFKDTALAAPGPFTTWTIIIDPSLNKQLDVSGINSIHLEFHGSGYPT